MKRLKQEERLDRIVEILRTQSLLTVQDICDLFQVSRDTARRDLVLLEEQGRITRTRGEPSLPMSGASAAGSRRTKAPKRRLPGPLLRMSRTATLFLWIPRPPWLRWPNLLPIRR
ncbi:DeoR family transcriptional regulator [Paenibacillus sp. P26]|nr:DeoR family transcriptional regulator [Paenibacillus sp. P26]